MTDSNLTRGKKYNIKKYLTCEILIAEDIYRQTNVDDSETCLSRTLNK